MCAVQSNGIRDAAMAILTQEPLISKIDYVSVGSRETMEELQEVGKSGGILSTAVRIGTVRLIDNLVLGER
jgi:pantoate--beta-alanine ligase